MGKAQKRKRIARELGELPGERQKSSERSGVSKAIALIRNSLKLYAGSQQDNLFVSLTNATSDYGGVEIQQGYTESQIRQLASWIEDHQGIFQGFSEVKVAILRKDGTTVIAKIG